MAKNAACWLVILSFICGCRGSISSDSINIVVPSATATTGDDQGNVVVSDNDGTVATMQPKTLQDVYLSQLYVREATGNNDGVDVEKYLASTNMPKGNPWCAAFVHWCFEQVHIPNKVTAWSPTAENKAHIVFQLRQFKEEPQTGDVVTFYYTNLGRIGHTGFFNRRINDVTYESVEGNTNGQGSREGNGVYKKFRPFNSTYSISRWPTTPKQ